MSDKNLMDQSSGSEIRLSGGCESESRVMRELGECAEMNYHPCDETGSQHSAEIEFNILFTKDNSGLKNTTDKCFAEQSNNSSADSNNELYGNDEFADLLRRYNAKFSSRMMVQSHVEPHVEEIGAENHKSNKSLSGGCESESRVTCDVEEYSDVNYNPLSEASSQHSAEIYSCENLNEVSSTLQNMKQEHLSERSDTSLDDLTEDLSESEEFAELLQQCYSKSESDVVMQSADGEETAGERSVETNCMKADVKEEDASDSVTSDADSSVTQLTDADKTTFEVRDVISSSQPLDAQHNRCPLCMKNFNNMRGLKRHIRRIHQTGSQQRCTQCDKSFNEKSGLTHHIKHVHGSNKYDCDQCDYSSVYSKDLKRHISVVHLMEKPHKCPQCDNSFSCKSHLMLHIKAVHDREKPYECSSCGKKFSQRNARDIHFRSVHCGEKPYSCDQCDYKFSEKGNLIKHQIAIHGEKQYACSDCEYKSSTQGSLQRHCIAVHNQQKPYPCSECGKAFSGKSDLTRHTDAVHKGLKPHACTECSSSFSVKSALAKHIKAVHLKEKLHQCSVCCKSFSTMSHVRAHEDAVHNGYSPYHCQQCSKSFSSKSKLNRHLKSVHK